MSYKAYNQFPRCEELISSAGSVAGASAILDLICMGDPQSFLELVPDSTNPGLLLIALSKKANKVPSANSKPPTDEEMSILAKGFEPSRRMVDVAYHIAADQNLEDTFIRMVEQRCLVEEFLDQQSSSAIRRAIRASANNIDRLLN